MPSVVVGEGDIDRAIIGTLCPSLDVPKPRREETQGREAAMVRAAVAAKQEPPQRVVLVVDRNGFTPVQLDTEVTRVIAGAWGGTPVRRGEWWVLGQSGVRLVIAGRPDDPLLSELGIVRFASDDYLLRLCLDDAAVQAFSASDARLAFRPRNAGELRDVLVEMVAILRGRGIVLETSKRFLNLVRAILGFEASRAEFASRLIQRAPSAIRDEVLGTLRHQIETDPPM